MFLLKDGLCNTFLAVIDGNTLSVIVTSYEQQVLKTGL